MSFSYWNKCVILSFGTAILLASTSFAQESKGSGQPSRGQRSAYPDDAQGLRALLSNMLEVAKNRDKVRLQALVKDTEIPNFDVWFTNSFGEEKGKSWATNYGKSLEENESSFEGYILHQTLTHECDDLSVRKLETSTSDIPVTPVDLFLAYCISAKTLPETIGYFFFTDGKFRWDGTEDAASALSAALPGASRPGCLYCLPPDWPKTANRNSKVAVTLKTVIRSDGHTGSIEVFRSGGSDFDNNAIEAVRKWRFRPAEGPDGVPVAVVQLLQVRFGFP